MRIGIDLDDTVFKYLDEFELRLYKQAILPKPKNNFDDYSLIIDGVDMHPYVIEEAQNHIYSSLVPFENAVNTINSLHDEGNEIVFITKRLFSKPYSTIVYDTEYSLQKYGIKYDELYTLLPTQCKSEFSNNCDLVIDDSPHEVTDYINNHKDVILFKRPYVDAKQFEGKCDIAYNWLQLASLIQERKR